MTSLRGKTALVTGGARGIGRGIAEALAAAGADVALADLGERAGSWAYELAGKSELEESARVVAKKGVRTLALACDVTDADQARAAVDRVCSEWGRLDVLVNNAGLVVAGPIAGFEEAAWDRLMAVNVKGVFLMARAAIPALSAAQGAMINIASIAGKRGYPGMGAYCASKFAVVGLTQSLAAELGPAGVRVNAICPGILGTAMWDYLGADGMKQMAETRTPLGRPQTPEDIGEAAVYLATTPNVAGIALNVAGGIEFW